MIKQNSRIFFYILCFSTSLALIGRLETIPVANGLGWDGEVYAGITKNFWNAIVDRQIDGYTIQRVLVSGLIYYFIKISNITFSNDNVILVFKLLNIIVLNISIILWCKISQKLNFNIITELLSVVFIFLNFGNLKMPVYYSVLTDSFTFFLGCFLLYAHLFMRRGWELFIGVLGAFTHPLLLIFCLILFVFDSKDYRGIKIPGFIKKYLLTFVPVAFILLVTFLFLFRKDLLIKIPKLNGTAPVNLKLIILSVLSVCVYLFMLIKAVIKYNIIEKAFKHINFNYLTLGIVLYVLIKFFQKAISLPYQIFSVKSYLFNIFLQSITNPGQFLLAHILYYGPVILLILFYSRTYFRNLEKLGVGFSIFVFIILFLAIGSESRQYIFALPFIILPLCFIIERTLLTRKAVFIYCMLSFVISKVWLPIGISGKIKGEKTTLLDFPDQFYFMTHGPWMSITSYVIQLPIIVFFALLIFFIIRKSCEKVTYGDLYTVPFIYRSEQIDSKRNA